MTRVGLGANQYHHKLHDVHDWGRQGVMCDGNAATIPDTQSILLIITTQCDLPLITAQCVMPIITAQCIMPIIEVPHRV
jgi:hypothetical protein